MIENTIALVIGVLLLAGMAYLLLLIERWPLMRASLARRWRATEPELRWRTITFTGLALAIAGRTYRSDDYRIQGTWLYSNLIAGRQLYVCGLTVALIGAYFWLGARWQGRP